MSWEGWAMRSKASSFENLIEKALFLSDLKRFWWLSGLYFVALLFNLPIYFLMQGASAEEQWQLQVLKDFITLTPNYGSFQILLIYAVPVLLAVLLFMYLHSARATAAVHSLPVTKNKLFITHCAAGILLLVLPVVLTGLALMVVGQVDFLQDIYSVNDVLAWMGQTLLFVTLFFAGAAFVGMFTGNPAAHIAFTYILLALPYGLYELLRFNLSNLLYGYSSANLFQSYIDNLPPYVLLAGNLEGKYFTPFRIGEYLLLIAAVFALALYAYRLRKLETAGDVIAFAPVKPLFKYGVTVCCTLVGGAYFSSFTGASQVSLPWTIFGYFISSLLGYFIAEVLIQKSFKVWNAYKGYLGYAILLALALLVVRTDAMGFVQRVPKPEEVEKVFFGSNIYAWSELQAKDKIKTIEDPESYYLSLEGPENYQEPRNIENIINLHKLLAHDLHADKGRQQYIVYTLKNGKHLIRQYNINEKEYTLLLKPIYESDEYKEARFPVLSQNPNEVKMLEVNDFRTSKKAILITGVEEISQLMGALRKDLANATYEEMSIEKNNYPGIVVTNLKNKRLEYAIRDSYSSVIQWLKEKGYYEKCILQPEEVESAVLEKRNQQNPGEATTSQRLETEDPKLINELLAISNNGRIYEFTEEKIIDVEFHTGNRAFNEYIHLDTPVSPELKKLLKRLQ